MSNPEAGIEHTSAGKFPVGAGWFVLNLRGARGFATEGHGVFCPFEAPDAPFEDFGINVHVLQPGERAALYHAESVQEDFLVLAGECVAVVDEQERTLGQWDFLHCPAGTTHGLIGAGNGPCAILMTGARSPDKTVEYIVDPVAAKHGVSVAKPATTSREAYADLDRTITSVPAPWPHA